MGISKTELFEDNVNYLAKVFAMLGHPARLTILFYLRDNGYASVGVMAETIPLAQSTISEHISVMKSIALVRGQRVGTAMQYYLHEDVHSALKDMLRACSEEF
jgi:DNA-binding transcriptional ArsR family regulator